jgi:hypothetical protein
MIEVLVASVILFMGLGAVLKAYSLAVVAMESAVDKLAVCQVLQQKAADAEFLVAGSGKELPGGSGVQTIGGQDYPWRIQSTRHMLTPQVVVVQAGVEVLTPARRGQGGMGLCEWTQYREKDQVR